MKAKPKVFDLPALPDLICENGKWVSRVRRSVYTVAWQKGVFHCISYLKRSNKPLASDLIIAGVLQRESRGSWTYPPEMSVFGVERIKGKSGKACFNKTFGFNFHEVFV